MATDNRHRPGPPFRCPRCKGHGVDVYEEVGIRRNSSARRRASRVFRAKCLGATCTHSWLTQHPHARDQYEAKRANALRRD